jgi:hypothetical protein
MPDSPRPRPAVPALPHHPAKGLEVHRRRADHPTLPTSHRDPRRPRPAVILPK